MDCGPEGTCVEEQDKPLRCQCNSGATNMLNDPSLPCTIRTVSWNESSIRLQLSCSCCMGFNMALAARATKVSSARMAARLRTLHRQHQHRNRRWRRRRHRRRPDLRMARIHLDQRLRPAPKAIQVPPFFSVNKRGTNCMHCGFAGSVSLPNLLLPLLLLASHAALYIV
jgi:hypothetical protein